MTKRFKNWKRPKFDKDGYTIYGWRCQHSGNLLLGTDVDVGCYTYMNAKFGITLEDNVQIGSHCSLYSISTEDNKEGSVTIGENTTVGTHSTVMPGVTIGKNTIIGAYSFVSKDIPDSVLAYGIPCKVVRRLGDKNP